MFISKEARVFFIIQKNSLMFKSRLFQTLQGFCIKWQQNAVHVRATGKFYSSNWLEMTRHARASPRKENTTQP